MKKIIILLLSLLFVECNTNNTSTNTNKKENNMQKKSLYPDSLTATQQRCVEKKFALINDPNHEESSSFPAEQIDGYMTEDEKDALIEIAIFDLRKKYNSVSDTSFSRRFKEVFGSDFDNFFKSNRVKITKNCCYLVQKNPDRLFYISKKEKVIVEGFNFGLDFEDLSKIKSVKPYSRSEEYPLGNNNKIIWVNRAEHMFHQNNYLFNEANVSRTWLIIKDPYFMSHLLIEYGYDGDNEINKLVLKKIKEDDKEIIDIPVDPFHIYPDGRVKILDGLLKTAAEMSTAECADYFDWATSSVDLLSGADDSKDKIWRIKHLTVSQRREIIAHIVDYMLPIYHKFLGTNYKYGTIDVDFGDLRIIDCFWNSLMQDHELISEIEKNGYYGLSNLQSQVEAIKDFKPFYNEESGEFEPWNYVPMRYRNSDDE